MKHIIKALLLSALGMMLAITPALAESVSFSGTVTAAYSHDVYTSFTGTIEKLTVSAGDSVTAATAIASLRTSKVYAPADGTVAAVFAQSGDSAEAVAERYGAVLYIDDGVHYTIAASTEGSYAYDSVTTRFVQLGETVALRSRSDEDRTGTGRVIAVDGVTYTVEVTSGAFIPGESVNVYRGEDFADEQRIGRGDAATRAPLAVTGTGRILHLAVQPGDTVQHGDLLMETLEGSPDAGATSVIAAGREGVVGQLYAAQGDVVTQGMRIASIWPADAMQIEAIINESDLGAIAVGDTVNLTFDWNPDGEPLQGIVSAIAATANEASADTCYTAYITFTPDASVRYGMNVTVETVE